MNFIKQSYRKHPRFVFFVVYFHRFARRTQFLLDHISFKYYILYVRWSFCKRLGELSIFRQCLLDEIPKCENEYISRVVPSFSSKIDEDHSADDKSYSTSAWKKFFDQYLSKDGIILLSRQNSCGPDVILRVSVPINGVSSAPEEGKSSQK
jgi:hypothetical protein